jgi:predicted house-cleaning NTP pyrophosphatase (Maf/HAM1 superfamily)
VLRLLSGRTHTVHTAVAVARDERIVSGVEDVAVTFRALGDDEIDEVMKFLDRPRPQG